jgi:hypothetical protein
MMADCKDSSVDLAQGQELQFGKEKATLKECSISSMGYYLRGNKYKRPGDACLAPTGAERRGSLPSLMTCLQEYIGREVAHMTAYEIISIFLGILTLLFTFGSLIVALLAFLDKRNKPKK